MIINPERRESKISKAEEDEKCIGRFCELASTPEIERRKGVKSPQSVQKLIDDLQGRVVPISLVLMPVAQAMLITGCTMESAHDCFFQLPRYLILAGAMSLSMGVMEVVAPLVIQIALLNRTKPRRWILRGLEYLSYSMEFVQVMILIFGWVVVLPNLSQWQSDHPTHKESYCEYGPVVFIISYLTIVCFFLLLTAVCYAYIWIESRRHQGAEKRHFREIQKRIQRQLELRPPP